MRHARRALHVFQLELQGLLLVAAESPLYLRTDDPLVQLGTSISHFAPRPQLVLLVCLQTSPMTWKQS